MSDTARASGGPSLVCTLKFCSSPSGCPLFLANFDKCLSVMADHQLNHFFSVTIITCARDKFISNLITFLHNC